jgi:hypothetical protein
VAFLLGSLFASLSFAQGTAVITGTVTDAATGKPVPDAVITATSPALQGEEVVVTDSAGSYRLAQLPAGQFSLRLEKESYKPFTRGDISVRTDRTIRLNLQLQPEALKSEEIVVVGKPPSVDVGSTATGINVGKEFINNIAFVQPGGAGVRSFESLASVAPQVVGDDFGYGFSGAQSPENLYLVDGVSVSDPAFGTNGAQFPVDFVQEANVVTGGYMAEYGRATGGVLNVVTKSGSNEFHGSVFGNWSPGALSGTPKTIKSDASVFTGSNKLWNTVDFGAEVGGPIVKDKLWFYVGFSPSFVRTQSTRELRAFTLNATKDDFQYDADGFIKSTTLPGTLQSKFNDTRAFSYIAKLTYLINADNNLSASVIGSPTTVLTPKSFTDRHVPGWDGASTSQLNTSTVSLKYAGGFMDKHLLVDASAGWYHQDGTTTFSDGTKLGAAIGDGAAGTPAVSFRRGYVAGGVSPHSILDFENLNAQAASFCEAAGTKTANVVKVRGVDRFVMACPVDTYGIGGAGYLNDTSLDRLQAKAAVTYLFQAAGHHIVKAGADMERLSFDNKKAYSGGNFLRENTTGSRFDDYRQYGYFTDPDQAVQQAYVHSVSSSLGVAGFIQDSWNILDLVTLNAGVRYENQQLFAADGTLGLTLNNMVSPRVGVIYDFTQQGRSKLFANYARYFEAVPIDIADRSLTGENQYQFRRGITTAGGKAGCNPLANISQTYTECRDEGNIQQINRLLGNDYNVNAGGQLTGSGKTPVDPNLTPQNLHEITAGGEYEVIPDGRVAVTYTRRWFDRVVEDMSLDEASTYFISNPGYGMGSAFPVAVRDYDAVTASFTKAFSDGWMAQASYTWSYLRGNYNGLFRPETGQLDPNINSDFDLISLMANRTGPLDANRTHFIKAYGSKEFILTGNLGLSIGLSYEGHSGSPINYLASHPIYGPGESFVLPRGSGGNLPWRHAINLKASVNYRISKDNQIGFSVDVFNLFNFQAVTAVDQTLSEADLLPYNVPAGQTAQVAACFAGNNPNCVSGIKKYDSDTGKVVGATASDFNPNFKQPTAYQSPISVRFGLNFKF